MFCCRCFASYDLAQNFDGLVQLWEQGRAIFPEPLCALIPACFIFHLIWAPLSCSPLPSALIPTKILTPAIVIAPHLEPKMPLCVPFLLPFWADPCPWQASCLISGVDLKQQKNEFIPTLYLFWLCLATLAWTIKILSQAFSHFLSERPNLRPASIFVTAGNHFETTCAFTIHFTLPSTMMNDGRWFLFVVAIIVLLSS